jgi:hypothetical protein
MPAVERLRNEDLADALDEAIAKNRPQRLYKLLGLASGLPGTRANMGLANAFASDLAARGKKADALAFKMATLAPDVAPGASEREFLPVCGVLAVGARAAADKSIRQQALAVLHDAAEDPRFRVRDAVPLALARIGEKMGDDLTYDLETWMNGYFQAAAVLLALEHREFLSTLKVQYGVINRLHDAFALACNAPRSAARYPGFKALMEALGHAPAAISMVFGIYVVDRLVMWSEVQIPEMREIIRQNMRDKRLQRMGDELDVLRRSMKEHEPKDRHAARRVEGTRGRSKRRGH